MPVPLDRAVRAGASKSRKELAPAPTSADADTRNASRRAGERHRQHARGEDRYGGEQLDRRESMAQAPWRARQSAALPDVLRRPEFPGVDRVALHLDMECLVVDAKNPRRLALVSIRNIKGQAYRLTLCLNGDALGQLPEREASFSSLSTIRACHGATRTQLSDQRLDERYGRITPCGI
jgi:hypothetical protein